ncbi:MAG TPA: hypothetical protein VHL11_11545 [Phototrophicaceae bacterium]|jgi:hypothetical protein|nr:hypothetical protein [Phototrophicaceae bacterium]
MRSRAVFIVIGGTVTVIGMILFLALFLIPDANPAFDVAVDFVNAAASGDDVIALPLLSPDLQTYVIKSCPDASVSSCVKSYTPAEWGDMMEAVFRRAIPDGDNAWDVLLFATYEKGQGFSGVCIYNRVERVSDAAETKERWQVTRWSGFIACKETNAGLSELRSSSDIPNRAP